jgi:CHAD domain-containing protein
VLRPYRDAQALVETIAIVQEYYGDVLHPEILTSLSGRFTQERDIVSNGRLDAALDQVAYRLGAIQPAFPTDYRPFAVKDLRKSIARVYVRGRKAMLLSKRKESDAVMHEWRKRAKYLRYQHSMLGGQDIPYFKDTEDSLHRLTDILGDHHNLELLRIHIQSITDKDARTMQVLRVLIRRRQKQLWKKSGKAGAPLFSATPPAYVSRIIKALPESMMHTDEN